MNQEESDKARGIIKRWFSAYLPDKDKEPLWYKIWMVIMVILTIIVVISAIECYNFRQELGKEQTKQLVSCPSFNWTGSKWESNITFENATYLKLDNKECCLFSEILF